MTKAKVQDLKKGMENKKSKTKTWQKPTLEDVSEKIMAQPYIRFT